MADDGGGFSWPSLFSYVQGLQGQAQPQQPQNWFTGFLGSPWTQAGSAGLGFGADLYSFFENLSKRNQINQIYEILQNPNKLAAYAQKLLPQYSPAAVQLMNNGINANWASTTGGAPGGAATANTANAWAALTSQNWQEALRTAIASLTGGGREAGALPNQPLGNLQGIMKSLAALNTIRTPAAATGIAPTFTAPQTVEPDAMQGTGSGMSYPPQNYS